VRRRPCPARARAPQQAACHADPAPAADVALWRRNNGRCTKVMATLLCDMVPAVQAMQTSVASIERCLTRLTALPAAAAAGDNASERAKAYVRARAPAHSASRVCPFPACSAPQASRRLRRTSAGRFCWCCKTSTCIPSPRCRPRPSAWPWARSPAPPPGATTPASTSPSRSRRAARPRACMRCSAG